MKIIKKILQAIAFTVSLVWSVSALADFQDGADAFILGDYKKAFAEFMPLAKQVDDRPLEIALEDLGLQITTLKGDIYLGLIQSN